MRQKALESDSRRADRITVRLTAALREPGTSTRFDVTVLDMSMTGLRFETSFTLRPGQHIFLTIPSLGVLDAEVAWQRSYVYGARFERPLHPAVLDHLAKQHRVIEC